MICLAWRAADTAAAWKERNAGMGPLEAASATVTTLRNKLDNTRERRWPVPEYEPPRWLTMPVALVPAQRLNQKTKSPWDPSLIASCDRCDVIGWYLNKNDRAERCTHPTSDEETV